MKRYTAVFAVLFSILIALVWLLLAERKPDRHTAKALVARSLVRTEPPISDASALSEVKRQRRPKRPAYARKYQEDMSESELVGDDEVVLRQPNYPTPPEPPIYDMPKGPDIVPFSYQRLSFKNAPKGQRTGLALYLTLRDEKDRKLAFAHRAYLQRLTTFLASKYDFSAVQSVEGKRKFMDMLEVRFRRRVKGDLIQGLDSAFFDAAE